jgi:hypothetical protein
VGARANLKSNSLFAEGGNVGRLRVGFRHWKTRPLRWKMGLRADSVIAGSLFPFKKGIVTKLHTDVKEKTFFSYFFHNL